LHAQHSAKLSRPLSIRLWRQVEMPALLRLYQQNTLGTYGPLVRSEAYQRWLVGRKAFDSLLIAIDGPDRFELEEAHAPIVGYAVLRQQRIAELLTAPDHPTAGVQLLARACADAIERNQQDIYLDAPPKSEVHDLVRSAGGIYNNQELDQGEVFMVRVLEPLKFLNLLRPELEVRSKRAGLSHGLELGLAVDDAKWQIAVTRRGIRARAGKLGRSYLTLNRAEFTRLVLGHASIFEAAEAGRIRASTRTALDVANVLFPQLDSWRPSWDDLPA